MKSFFFSLSTLFLSFYNYAQCPVDSVPVFAAVESFMEDSCYNNSFSINSVTLSQNSEYSNPDTSYQLHNSIYGVTEQGGYLYWEAIGHSNFGFGYRIGIWIDLDNNGFFESSEYIGGDMTSSDDPIMSSGFNIPLDATPDTVRLRFIKVASNASFPAEASCGSMVYPYGEVEDYYLIINCAPPAGIMYNQVEEFCHEPSYLLTAYPDYGGILWYDDTLASSIADTFEFDFNPLVGDTTIYIQPYTFGCLTNELLPIEISVLPSPIVNILGPDTIVSCSSYTFDAGPGHTSYQWFTGETTQTITVTTAYGDNAWVNVTNSSNCISTDYVVASIAPDPPATYATYYLGQNYCDNDVVTLNYDSLINPGTIEWHNNSMVLIGTGNWMQYSPSGNGNDTIIGAINSVCGIDTANLIIQLPQPVGIDSIYSPEIMTGINGDPLFCYSSGSISLIAVGGNYQVDHWIISDTTVGGSIDFGYGLDTLTFPTSMFTPGNVYSATVVLQNSAGCFVNVDSIFATATTSYSLNFSDTSTICQLPTGLGPNLNNTQYDIIWNTGENITPITISSQGLYTLSIYDNTTGCSDFDSTYIIEAGSIFNPLEDSALICGTDITLDAGPDFADYYWEIFDLSGGLIDQSYSQQYYGTESGIYTLYVMSNEGCDLFDTIVVSFSPAISINLGPDVNSNTTPYVINGPAGYSSYLWSNGSTSQNASVDSAGIYSLTVTNSAGCTTTDSINVTFSIGIDNLSSTSNLSIFPIPVIQEEITIASDENILLIEVFDLGGKLVESKKYSLSSTQTLNIGSLKNGIYTLRISTSTSVLNKKITIQL